MVVQNEEPELNQNQVKVEEQILDTFVDDQEGQANHTADAIAYISKTKWSNLMMEEL